MGLASKLGSGTHTHTHTLTHSHTHTHTHTTHHTPHTTHHTHRQTDTHTHTHTHTHTRTQTCTKRFPMIIFSVRSHSLLMLFQELLLPSDLRGAHADWTFHCVCGSSAVSLQITTWCKPHIHTNSAAYCQHDLLCRFVVEWPRPHRQSQPWEIRENLCIW